MLDEFRALPTGTSAEKRARSGSPKALLDVSLLVVLLGVTCCVDATVLRMIGAMACCAVLLKLASHTGHVLAGRCPQCDTPQEVPMMAHIARCSACFAEFLRVRLPDGEHRFKPWHVRYAR